MESKMATEDMDLSMEGVKMWYLFISLMNMLIVLQQVGDEEMIFQASGTSEVNMNECRKELLDFLISCILFLG